MNNKKEDEIYCPECGKAIKKKAVIYPHCKVQLKELNIKKSTLVKSKRSGLSARSSTSNYLIRSATKGAVRG